MPSMAKSAQTWRLLTPIPPREVFAVAEQMLGTPPFRFEVVGEGSARIVEAERTGFFGQWRRAKRRIRWITVKAVSGPAGTEVVVEASKSAGLLSPWRSSSAVMRGLQLVSLLSRGTSDRRTIYRDRRIPDGPVTLVASWAGTPYPLFAEPRLDGPRDRPIHTAVAMTAIPGGDAHFVRVRLADGTEGFVERDQVVPAPSVATRDAQVETARFG